MGSERSHTWSTGSYDSLERGLSLRDCPRWNSASNLRRTQGSDILYDNANFSSQVAAMSSGTNSHSSEATDRADVAFHPPVLLGTAIAAGFAARWLAAASFLPSTLSTILGPVVTLVAFLLFFWSAYTMHKGEASIPTNEPTDKIVLDGPFSFSRNPIYLSMLLLLVGIGIWANSLWFIGLGAVAFILLSWGVIAREEQYLRTKFGEEYESYKARVRRWL